MMRLFIETRWTNWGPWQSATWGRYRRKQLKLVRVTIAELWHFEYRKDSVVTAIWKNNKAEEFILTIGEEHESEVKPCKTERAALRRLNLRKIPWVRLARQEARQ